MRDNQVAGVDAGRIGDQLVWVIASSESQSGSEVRFMVHNSFRELWQQAKDSQMLVVAIDMPLGLPSGEQNWRKCETEARELLGPDRRETVFMAPPLWLMDDRDPEQERNWERRSRRGLAKENPRRLLDRCREVRNVLDPDALDGQARPRAAEVHAEICFWSLKGDRPTGAEKRESAGRDERLELLSREFAGINDAVDEATQHYGPASHDYDFLDAAAAAWTARRIVSGSAETLGSGELDAMGYPMSIWV